MPAGPNFLCIGMMKAGTAWLYDQLQHHPDFWMPPVKEVQYLSRSENRGVNAKKILDAARDAPRKLRKISQAAQRPWDERDFQFLEEMAGHRGNKPDLARYASLFRHKGDLLSGDITPQYCALDPELIAEVACALPDTRGILIVRDPVARAWSAICMLERMNRFDAAIAEDAEALRNFLDKKKFRNLSLATETARRWSESAPNMQIRTFFFDDIAENPAKVRNEVLSFLGADPAKASGQIDAGHNKKSGKKKLALTDGAKAVLVDYFRDELHNGAQMFGGRARDWPADYGL
jgi:hypothetical protein